MTLFLDRNFGPRVPQALRVLNIDVVGHDERFRFDTPDEVWLAEAGRQDWVVITHDRGIAENEKELAAVVAGNVPCFVLPGGNASHWEKVREFAFAWRKINAILNDETPPYVWHRSPRGWVRLYP